MVYNFVITKFYSSIFYDYFLLFLCKNTIYLNKKKRFGENFVITNFEANIFKGPLYDFRKIFYPFPLKYILRGKSLFFFIKVSVCFWGIIRKTFPHGKQSQFPFYFSCHYKYHNII